MKEDTTEKEEKTAAQNSGRQIFANPELCTGCGVCMAACSVRMFGEASPYKSAIQIKRDLFEGYEIQFLCRHCEEPRCVEACFTGITTKDPRTGAVSNRPDECVGCWSCLMVCPYGAIRQVFNENTGRMVAVKCDSCPERDVPACVTVCPTQALVCK